MMGAQHLTTGVPDLDGALTGGYAAGAVVCLKAPAGTQSEVLLKAFASEHSVLYVSTTRTERAVRASLGRGAYTATDAFVIRTEQGAPLSDAADSIETVIGDTVNVIIDPVNVIERGDGGHYLNFLNKLKAAVQETGGVAIVHCYDTGGGGVSEAREHTIGMADIVMSVEREVSEENVEQYLDIPKNRFGGTTDERMKVSLGDRVEVDTTRNIS
jgi:ribosomal protein S17